MDTTSLELNGLTTSDIKSRQLKEYQMETNELEKNNKNMNAIFDETSTFLVSVSYLLTNNK